MPAQLFKWASRVFLFVALIVATYALLFYSKLGPGDQIPPFSITSTNGKVLDSNNLPSKLQLIHFWAYWCDTCLGELDQLNKLEDGYSDLVDIQAIHDGMTEIDINAVNSLLDIQPINYNVYMDSGKIADLFGIKMVPVSYLVNSRGEILKKYIGAVKWTEPDKINMLKLFSGGDKAEQ